jgi:dihydropteroate synthase
MLMMGIINVTPDSFFDGGKFRNWEAAVAQGERLVAEGADFLDIGGESTRPNAAFVSEEEELARVIPVIRELSRRVSVPISVDTTKAAVARAAVEAGACIINDVAAGTSGEEMFSVLRETGAGYVLMHIRGTPQTMQQGPFSDRIVEEVDEFFARRLQALERAGIWPEQVVLDVGIGFGKSVENNLQLLRNLRRFTAHLRPLLLGVSRKSFIGKVCQAAMEERLFGSLSCACWGAEQGIGILRTHDVKPTLQAVRMMEAILQQQQLNG